ncbi:RTA1-domain-containing protein [Ganoderma leucocontextum]|nr:RTA1-domain-containing protein [Ganoderma leucocontextum]
MSTVTTSTLSSSVPSTSSTQQPVPHTTIESLRLLFYTAQALHLRLWWLLPTVCMAGIGEILGWSARLWSSQNVYLNDPFIMQITTMIIIIRRIGQKYSRVSATWYTVAHAVVLISQDVIALVIQPIGGGSPFWAAVDAKNPETGGHIMLAGVSFQMVALVVYVVLASEFILRYAYDHPFGRCGESTVARRKTDKQMKLMLLGLVLEAVFLFELSNGWTGKTITTEWYFGIVVFDGTMIMLAVLTLNIFHPGLLLGKAHTWLSREAEEEIKAKGLDKESV